MKDSTMLVVAGAAIAVGAFVFLRRRSEGAGAGESDSKGLGQTANGTSSIGNYPSGQVTLDQAPVSMSESTAVKQEVVSQSDSPSRPAAPPMGDEPALHQYTLEKPRVVMGGQSYFPAGPTGIQRQSNPPVRQTPGIVPPGRVGMGGQNQFGVGGAPTRLP